MASVRIVPYVHEELRLARAGGEHERTSGDRSQDLSQALLLHFAALLEGLMIEPPDHVPGALVHDDLFLPELLARRRHAIATAQLGKGDLEDAAQKIAERVPGVPLRSRFRPTAFRAHPIRRRGVGPAMNALVSEALGHVDRRLLGIDQVPLGAGEAALVRQDLVPLLHLDERTLWILRVVHDADFFRDGRQMQGEGLGDHGFPRARGSDEEEVAPLVRGDPGQFHGLILADDALQRIVRDRDFRGRLEVVEGESLVGREQLRSRDERHLAYGARSLRVQTTTPAGCFVIVPIFVPTTECMFISAAMSRIRWVMMPSNTTARVCFAFFSVSTSSRTGTSVTTASPSSRRRAVEDPPSWTSISRYFSSFGFSTFVVGVSGTGATSRNSRASARASGLGSGRGSAPRSDRPWSGTGEAGLASGNSDSGLYTWPESPYISTYRSAGILFLRAFMICFCVSSSTSFPRGARAMKSTSATWRSSFRIRSPPRSPSTKAVRALSFDSSWTVFGTLVPSTAIAFLMPDRRSVRTSCRPSTMMIASLSAMFGPAGSRSDPNETISDTWTLCRTSSRRSEPEVFESSTMDARRARARSMILFLFVTRTSSTFSTLIVALHGPTRSIVSRAAAKMDVSTWSSEDGIRIRPSLRPFLLCTSTSMRPMRPPFCRSRKSSSSPRSPSVWPNTAPTTSGFSTIPSASIRAWIMYLVVLGSMFMFALVRAGVKSAVYVPLSGQLSAPQGISASQSWRQERMIRMSGICESRPLPLSRFPTGGGPI